MKTEKGASPAGKVYDRIAPVYDLIEGLPEWLAFRRWRALLWSKVTGPAVLEVGVGTGKNFPYYPPGVRVTGVDISPKMLARARARARRLGIEVDLKQMDIQRLEFPDDRFDTVVSTFVFCSVPDPVQGLREVYRVTRPGGQVLLLEHVLSSWKALAWLMNLVNPLVRRLMGPNINRRTVGLVRASGLRIERVSDLSDIFKLIEARKPER
ncbi:MAG: class I SAM-dependent methyltransferase [Chloroflexi bacterium]|nr:class I SAM-dependent methyltransferase [Chloroflexota bacterium]